MRLLDKLLGKNKKPKGWNKMTVRKAVVGDRFGIASAVRQTYARADQQFPGALSDFLDRNWTAATVAGFMSYIDTSWVTTNDATGRIDGVVIGGVENRVLQNGQTEKWYVVKIMGVADNIDNLPNWHKRVMYRLLKSAIPDAKNRLGCVGAAAEIPTGLTDLVSEFATFTQFGSQNQGNGITLCWIRFSANLSELAARDSS